MMKILGVSGIGGKWMVLQEAVDVCLVPGTTKLCEGDALTVLGARWIDRSCRS